MIKFPNLIFKTANIFYELDQFVRVESIESNTPYNDIFVKYFILGIEKDKLEDNREMKIFEELPIRRTIYIPKEADDFLTKKSQENNIAKNVFFVNYVISGIEQKANNLSNLQRYWFNLLKQDK